MKNNRKISINFGIFQVVAFLYEAFHQTWQSVSAEYM